MKMTKFFIALFLLLSLNKSTATNPDSLRKVLLQQRNSERLPTLMQLCISKYKGVLPNEEARQYANEIFQLTTNESNSEARVKACLCIVTNQDYSSANSDSPLWLSKAQDLATNQPEWLSEVLYRWGSYYSELGKPDSAIFYIKKAIEICKIPQLQAKKTFLLAVSAKIYSNIGKKNEADSLIQLAFKLSKTRADSIAVFSNYGGVEKDLGHPESAAKALLTAYQLSLDDGNFIVAAFNLNQYATILRDEGKLKQAIAYLEEVLQLSQRAQYTPTIAGAYNSLGVLYQKTGEYEKALLYYRLALTLKKEMGRPKKILNTIQNMAELYIRVGQNDSCLSLCRQYLPLSKEIKYAQIESELSFLAARAAAIMGQKTQAREYLTMGEKALIGVKITEEMPEIYQTAAQTYALLGSFDKAYDYQILFQRAKDSVSNAEKSRAISELETRYETQKKEQQIAVLAKDNQLKRTQQYALFGGLGLLGVLAFVLSMNIRIRKRHNDILTNTNDELTQKNNEVQTLLREIHHRVKNNLQIISSLLKLQARRVSDENAHEALQTGQARVRSMALLHQRLYQGEQLKDIPMRPYMMDLTESLLNVYQNDEKPIELHLELDDLALDVDTAVPLGLIANELITNSLKYAFPNGKQGEIRLRLLKQQTGFRFSVSDNGVGIPLSIDGKPITQRTSFGLELVESLTQKLKGQLTFSNNQGTQTELIVPFNQKK